MKFEQTKEQSPSFGTQDYLTSEQKLERLKETLAAIDEALGADDFYHADADEVLKSREFFESQYKTLVKIGGSAVASADGR